MKNLLVVIDMQVDFTTGALGNAECTAAIEKVINTIKSGKYDAILATRDTHQENYMDTLEGKNLPVVHCIEGTAGWEIVPEIEAAIREANGDNETLIFNKPTFGSVELAEYIKTIYENDNDITVDFVGVCTGICVISNVSLVKAFCPNALVRVISDACACVTPDTNNTAIDAMKTFQVEIV